MQLTSDLVTLSQDLLHIAHHNKYAKSFKYHLANLSLQQIVEGLEDSEEKKFVFWVNIYNAFVQILLKEKPSLYKQPQEFHNTKLINIAGTSISLSQIENGIIRNTKKKRKRWFLTGIEKECRLKDPSFKVHFSLNQASKSSPPIVYYEVGKSQQQLDELIKFFFQNNAQYVAEDNTVCLPKMIYWYRADFGYKKGILKMLRSYDFLPEEINPPKIKYKKYDWSISLNNFMEESPNV